MKPFQPRCPSAQIERKWPATKDYFSFGEEAIAFLASPRAGGAWCQVASRSEGRPRFANFPVIPAPSVGQFDRRIDCLNLRSIFGADALNTQDVDPLHGHLPKTTHAEQANHNVSSPDCNWRPLAAGGCNVTNSLGLAWARRTASSHIRTNRCETRGTSAPSPFVTQLRTSAHTIAKFESQSPG